MSSEKSSKSLEAFAWGDNTGGCLGLPLDTSAGLLPRTVEPYGLLPGERVVAVSCSERYIASPPAFVAFTPEYMPQMQQGFHSVFCWPRGHSTYSLRAICPCFWVSVMCTVSSTSVFTQE